MSEPQETGKEQPEIVCLCGSTRFKDEYRAENRRLTMQGKIVLSVGLFGHADNIDLSREEKEMLDELHKRKIDLADYVHVINPGGYIGDSTESEIKYAKEQGTPVSYLEQPVQTDGGEPQETDTERSGRDSEKPLGMSTVAWRGCSCGACRGERKRYLGREEFEGDDQATLGGFSDE